MIIRIRDPYDGVEKMFNLDKFIYSVPSSRGEYELIFADMRVEMDYKEYERFKAAVDQAQSRGLSRTR